MRSPLDSRTSQKYGESDRHDSKPLRYSRSGGRRYQLTDDGLALELTAKGTKYYKDDALN